MYVMSYDTRTRSCSMAPHTYTLELAPAATGLQHRGGRRRVPEPREELGVRPLGNQPPPVHRADGHLKKRQRLTYPQHLGMYQRGVVRSGVRGSGFRAQRLG